MIKDLSHTRIMPLLVAVTAVSWLGMKTVLVSWISDPFLLISLMGILGA